MPTLMFETAPPIRGWNALAFGWLGVVCLISPAWLANLTYLIAIRIRRRSVRASQKWALISVALGAFTFLIGWRWPVGTTTGFQPLVAFGIGVHVWLLSFLLLLLPASISRKWLLSIVVLVSVAFWLGDHWPKGSPSIDPGEYPRLGLTWLVGAVLLWAPSYPAGSWKGLAGESSHPSDLDTRGGDSP